MSFAIRPARLAQDKELMLRVLERNLPDLDHRSRFEWAYLNNPAGTAWSWLAVEKSTGHVIAVASVFPKIMWIGGEAMKCGQVGDFAVESKFRSLGPALALQRATLALVDEGTLALCYDCPPHERGMAPFRRLGLDITCRLGHFTQLLNASPWIARRFHVGAQSARLLAIVPNQLLRLRRFLRSGARVEVTNFEERFEDDFSRLDERLVDPRVIRTRRSATELNWKYRDDPLRRYKTLIARDRGELLGFLVYETNHERATICDLLATSPDAAMTLFWRVLIELDRMGVEAVTLVVPEVGPQSVLARRAGFSFRGNVEHIVAYGPTIVCGDGRDGARFDWFTCWGDIAA